MSLPDVVVGHVLPTTSGVKSSLFLDAHLVLVAGAHYRKEQACGRYCTPGNVVVRKGLG